MLRSTDVSVVCPVRSFVSPVALSALLALSLACSGSKSNPASPVQDKAPAAPTELQKAIDDYVASYGAVRGEGFRFSGHVHVVKNGEVLFSKGYEFADRSSKTSNGPDTSFRIGSVTKQFTAAAIFLLAKQGKLKLSDPIRTHLPNYPAASSEGVTIQHLLNHTGGVPSYTNDMEFMKKRDQAITTDGLMAVFRDKPLEFKPGERFNYSNSGYVLLGAIVETVSGMSYAEFMQKNIFIPAGLTSTVVGDAKDASDRALGYQTGSDGAVIDADPIDMSVPHAAGAIRSSSADLVRWHQVLRDASLIDAELQAQMLIPSEVSKVTRDGTTRGYAAGWSVAVNESKGRTVVRHGGGIDGFSTSYIRVPKDDLVIISWSNNPTIGAQPMANAALAAVFGEPIEPHVEKPILELSAEEIAQVVGVYTLTEASEKDAKAKGLPAAVIESLKSLEVAANAKSIEVKPAGQQPIPFNAESKTVFVYEDAGIRLEFIVEADGKASTVVLKQGPLVLTLERK